LIEKIELEQSGEQEKLSELDLDTVYTKVPNGGVMTFRAEN